MLPQQGARALGRPLADSGIVAAGRMARQARRFGWAALLALDLLLGAAVWLFHLTDYGLAGALSDLLFLLLVGLLGLLSLRLAPRLADGRARRAARLAALLPLSGGAFYVVALPFALAGIVLLPWASYRMAYAVEEMAAERPIQQTLSPGRTWLARVYFQPVGDNAGYRGHVWIRVAPPALPFLERRTYYLPVTRVADGQWQEYVTWLDDDTLDVAETHERVSVGPTRTRLPGFVAVPLGWLVNLAWAVDPAVGAPLADLPIYPGRLLGGDAAYSGESASLQRWYVLARERPDRVADWYREALATPPWSLEGAKLNRRENVPDRPTWKHYCLEAVRQAPDGSARIYYWEIMGFDQPRQRVWVNVSTPRPNHVVCQPYVNQPPD